MSRRRAHACTASVGSRRASRAVNDAMAEEDGLRKRRYLDANSNGGVTWAHNLMMVVLVYCSGRPLAYMPTAVFYTWHI